MGDEKYLRGASTFKNLVGQKFGRLTVEYFVGVNKYNRAVWLCRCRCGEECTATSAVLLRKYNPGRKRSCGCIHREQLIRRNKSRAKKQSRV